MAAHARKMGNPTNVLAPPVSPEVTVEVNVAVCSKQFSCYLVVALILLYYNSGPNDLLVG